ncbi:MAG: hypothetical protein RDU24_15015 [Humidesulfovibrio sp.]|uniref:hypothetical protein n=1 Tax=Humidesulfovibrio sp. TaxID=2910988 RepID=UPI0027EAD42C|nr:hypothetical protein [Humidesulfovibrio sp.]MDQ7836688.1 hypothetical protein [Humidesulfovibrio sp.]
MRKLCILFCLCLLLPTWARAEYPRVDDDLAVRVFCSGEFKGIWHGCGRHSVTLITAPEAEGKGVRLLAAYVENESLPDSAYMLLRGPAAARWDNLRPAPGYSKDRNAGDTCRYWADRLTVKPGGRMHNATVELDLGADPPVLRSLDGNGREMVEVLAPVPQSETAKMMSRSYVVTQRETRAMSFRVLEANMGDGGLRLGEVKVRDLPRSPLLVALAQKGEGGRRVVRVLEARQWWSAVRILSAPGEDDRNGAFVFEAMSTDLNPAAKDPDERRADLYRYEVTLDKVARTLVSTGWRLDVEEDVWKRGQEFRNREP